MALIDGRIPRLAALLREALAVLAAILIAFALDAWWDDRVERQAMIAALETGAMEVDRNLELLDQTRSYNQSSVAASRRALGQSLETLGDLSRTEVMAFADLPNYLLVTLEQGAITAFIEGGFLPVVDDLQLRVMLASLPRLQDELNEEGGSVALAMDRFTARLMAALPDELLLDPLALARSEAGTRAILTAIASDRDTRETFFERTFVLGFVYDMELVTSREQLMQARRQIAAALEAH